MYDTVESWLRKMILTKLNMNSSELFSYTRMYSNFVFLDRFLFELSCKNTHTHKHGHTHTHTHTHTDSNEYPIVAFPKTQL